MVSMRLRLRYLLLIAAWLLLAGRLSVRALQAQEPAMDPLTLLEKPAGANPAARLSPSEKAAEVAIREKAIDRALTFLDSWQSPNGSWDRLENADAIFGPHSSPKPGKLMSWESEPYDGPVKDLAENDVEQVADSALSAQSMLAAIASGRKPEMSKDVTKAIDFLCRQVELWKGDTIYIQKRVFDPLHDPTPAKGEPVYYLPTVDTFFALDFLVDARQRATDPAAKKKIERAVTILLDKIERRQTPGGGWADDTDPTAKMENVAYGGQGAKSFQEFATQAVAVKAICRAAGAGLPVKLDTLLRAQSYFRSLGFGDNKHLPPARKYVFDFEGQTTRVPIAAGTYYQVDLTNHLLLAAARHPKAGTAPISEAQLRRLEDFTADAEHHLQQAVEFLTNRKQVALFGPALAAMPDAILAVRQIAPEESEAFEGFIRGHVYERQRPDGHFVAGYLDDAAPTRGDNTFGTAATIRILMVLGQEKAATAPAPAPPAKGN